MLFAAIDQLPELQKLIAQGMIGIAVGGLILLVGLRFWNAMRGD